MITGDHSETGGAIAWELGLVSQVVAGAELDWIDDVALADKVAEADVFARVTPQHKIRIVRALQGQGARGGDDRRRR